MNEFMTRRNKLAAQMPTDSIAILLGGIISENSYGTYRFRQNSDFIYLTNFVESNAAMALCKDDKGTVSFVLFNAPRDPVLEVWDGKRVGIDGARSEYHADAAYDINDIDNVMPELLANKQVIYYPLGADGNFDSKILNWLNAAKKSLNKNGTATIKANFVPNCLQDILPLIHELRLFKSDLEIEYMRQAASISAVAHLKLMQQRQPGQFEYQLEAIFNAHCLNAGCRNLAYNSIVASGNNSCTLHYIANDQKLCAGDLILVDAGGEYNYYASDITRTFPVTGKFTPAQKAIYELVLTAQLAGIEQVKPGNTYNKVQETMVDIIVHGLIKLGLLQGDPKQLIQEQAYRKYYMHGGGHWLGLDTHDVGKYRIDNKWRKFQPGMVLTVEPGIYIANTLTDIDSKWHGIGVRIEDDVLVTKKGNEVLSHAAPKTIADIERVAL